MEEISFASLAPRRGTRPLLSPWSEIGTSSISGGALSLGSLWSGLRNFGSSLKTFGINAWNSNVGQALRNKLKDTQVQEKIIDGINAGVHGAIDIARQEMDRAIQKRLEQQTPLLVEPVSSNTTESLKRPREDELIITTDEPPAYSEIFPNNSPAPLVPMTKPHPALATPVSLDAPQNSSVNTNLPVAKVKTRLPRDYSWQNTLNQIVGLGVNASKKRRCF